MHKKVVIIGAGGQGKVLVDVVVKSGDVLLGFLDDNLSKGDVVLGFPVLGTINDISEYSNNFFIIGVGNCLVRKRISEQFPDLNYYTAIHPNATIGLNAKIGEGSCLLANSILGVDAVLGTHCIVNNGAIVDHDGKIEDFVHVSPRAALGGNVSVGCCTHIGIGAVVIHNINIGANCVIGAGAVVIKDINESGTYCGVPAKKNK